MVHNSRKIATDQTSKDNATLQELDSGDSESLNSQDSDDDVDSAYDDAEEDEL